MNRVIAAYDLDEDHDRLWVNADLKRMPEVIVVANQPMDRAQTVTYVPEARMLEAMDAAREAGRRADMADRVAADRKGLCDSLKETNADLRGIIDGMREAGNPAAENAKLRELIADVHEALKADSAGMFHRLTLTSMEDDMRELGIEVRGK